MPQVSWRYGKVETNNQTCESLGKLSAKVRMKQRCPKEAEMMTDCAATGTRMGGWTA